MKITMVKFASLIFIMFIIVLFALWNSFNNQFEINRLQTHKNFKQADHKFDAMEKNERDHYEKLKGKIDDSNTKIDSIQKNLDIKID